ncbi:MAG: hypothetical protein Q8J78_10770 [Moraxellaceae bacterium]|nr:hypothetical protein [Moraxellaceae bacterium]
MASMPLEDGLPVNPLWRYPENTSGQRSKKGAVTDSPVLPEETLFDPALGALPDLLSGMPPESDSVVAAGISRR